MLNEGIENTTVQFAAEKSPLRLKKFLKNHLLSHGIKVREKKTMERRSVGMNHSSTYDNDLFNGITFYTHDDKNIKVQVRGNSIKLNIGDSYFTKSMGEMFLKDLGDFIVESYKKATPKQETSTPSIDKDAEIEKLNNELGDKFTVKGKNPYSGEYGPDFILRINSHKFEVKIDHSHSKVLAVARRLLSDSVVKRNLGKYDKDFGEQRLYHSSIMHEKLPYIRDEVFEAVETFFNRIYSLDINVISVNFEDGEIRIKRPKPNDRFSSSKLPERRKKPTPIPKKEAIMKIKKQIIRESSFKKQEFNKYMNKLEEVAKPALKRFFKDPEKYL